MATLNYSWQNIASWSVSKGQATVTFYIDAKLSRQDTAGNYSVVDTRLNSTIVNSLSGSGYNFQLTGSGGTSGSSVWYFGNETILTGQYTVNHSDSGSGSSTVSAYAYNKYWGIDQWFSGSFTLPTIARASQPSCITYPNTTTNIGNIEDTITIHMNRKSSSFTHTVRYAFGTLSGTIATGVTDNCSWTIPDTFYSQIPNSNSGTGTIYADTYSGSTKIGTKSVTFTCKVSDANPTFTDFEFADINPITVVLTGDNQSIISGYSNIKATISTDNMAIALKDATMSKYRLSIGENNATDITYSSTEEVSGTLNNVTSPTVHIYAIDSRNNSTLVSKQSTNFYTYTPLEKGNISLERSDGGVGENVTLTYNGKIDLKKFGLVTNSIKKATYTIQRTDSSSITTGETIVIPTTQSDGSFSFNGLIKGDTTEKGFDIGSSYIVTVTVTDELSSITYTANLSSGTPNIALAKDGVGIMGKYDEELGGLLQVGGRRIDNYYSEEETPVGTWIDGRTIYRKVIYDEGGNSGSTLNTIAHGIENLDRVLLILWSAKDATSTTNNQYATARITNDGAYIGMSNINEDSVSIFANSAFGSRVQKIYIILEYIKIESNE